MKHGLSMMRKATGSGPVHRQAPFRNTSASCGVSIRDPMVRRSAKVGEVTCVDCMARINAGRAKARAELAAIEAAGR